MARQVAVGPEGGANNRTASQAAIGQNAQLVVRAAPDYRTGNNIARPVSNQNSGALIKSCRDRRRHARGGTLRGLGSH